MLLLFIGNDILTKKNFFLGKQNIDIIKIKKMIGDKKFVYKIQKIQKSMDTFDKWKRGKVRDIKIIYQIGMTDDIIDLS